MSKDYSQLVKNLKARRYDDSIGEHILSPSFYKTVLGDSAKYTLESMLEVDKVYSHKLYSIVQRIQDLLELNLRNRKIEVEFRYLGAHASDCHIRLFDDVELVVIPKKIGEKPAKAVELLAGEILQILDQTNSFNKLDYGDKCRIFLQTPNPVCDISILPAVWVDSSLYRDSKLEINRGICEYNLEKQTRKMYLPFLAIARLNARDRKVKGGLKSLIRLVRNIKEDAEDRFELSFDEICGVIYDISDKELTVDQDHLLSLLTPLSDKLGKLITDDKYRRKLISPSKKEYVFHNKDHKVEDLKKLKNFLDELIGDLPKDLENKMLIDPIPY